MDRGWHPDPLGRFDKRYHTGQSWTFEVRNGDGRPFIDTTDDERGSPPPPPAARPAARTVADAPKPPELSKNQATGLGCLTIVVIALVIWGITSLVGVINGTDNGGKGDKAPDTDELRYGAFSVCTDFVKDRLKSPGSAKFRNFFEEDGEVVVRSTDGVNYIVTSTVDSQNSFGALLRSNFICEVAHVSGTQWRLVEVNIL